MEKPLAFARQFANLVWLMLHDAGSAYEQQTLLDALVESSKHVAISLSVDESGLRSNDAVVSSGLTGVPDLSRQMELHGLAMVTIDAGATPSDIFGIAGILASMPVVGDGGAAADEKRREIGVKSIRFGARPRPSGPQPPRESVAILPDMDLGDLLEDPIAEARAKGTPRSTQTVSAVAAPRDTGMFAQFSAPRPPDATPDELLARLDTVYDAGSLTMILSDLAVHVEDAVRDGKAPLIVRIMMHLARHETQADDFEAKRAFALTLHRLGRPDVLRLVASQLTQADDREDYVGVLTRAGENGADALIEQLGVVSLQRDRRVFFELLVQLKAGVPSLLHMLRDGQWFVARNAAELLGEMEVREAEQPLTALLSHEDERVRRTAAKSLVRLGTTGAMHAIETALRSPAASMRIEAVGALASRKDERATAALFRALDVEKDDGVHVAMLGALGKIASAEAVQRLIRCAEPDKSLFKKKPTQIRVAAIHALAETGAPAALEMIRSLLADKDPDVKAAASGGLGRMTRRASGSVKPVE